MLSCAYMNYCILDRRTSAFGFEPHSPRYGPLLVLGSFNTHGAQSGPLVPIFGPFLGHIREVEGKNELFVTWQSWRMCSVATNSRRLSFRMGSDFFGRAPPDLAPLPRGATGEILAQS